MNKKLTIQIVGWNSAAVLGPGLSALENVPSQEATIVYIDNGSSDNSVALVRQLLPSARVIALPKNVGFARAHNLGLTVCATPFVLTHDPDVVINWQGIVSLLNRFSDRRVGAVQGKLLRVAKRGTRLVIDSTGIQLSLALNGVDRGADQVDWNQYSREEELIAVTGACALYRLEAVRSVAYSSEEFFDNDFFSYKEDVDLGWRLRNAGWQVLFVPIDMGKHQRTLGRRGLFNWGLNPWRVYQRLQNPRTRSGIRNWVWLIIKNASVPQLVIHGIPIAMRIFVTLGLSIFYPSLLTVWFEVIVGIPSCLRKRWHRVAGPLAP